MTAVLAPIDDSTDSFTTRDPLDGVDGTPDMTSPHRHTDNDPTNQVDPNGLRDRCDIEVPLMSSRQVLSGVAMFAFVCLALAGCGTDREAGVAAGVSLPRPAACGDGPARDDQSDGRLDFDAFDSPEKVVLPGTGTARAVSTVGDDVLVAEIVPKAPPVNQSGELSIRRIASDGDTRWVTRIGTRAIDVSSLDVEDGKVMVLWHEVADDRSSGEDAAVLTQLTPDGGDLGSQQAGLLPLGQSFLRLAGDGSVLVSGLDEPASEQHTGSAPGQTRFWIERRSTTGSAVWKDERSVPGSLGYADVAALGDDIYAALEDRLVAWGPDGTVRWEREMPVTDFAVVQPGDGPAADGDPALVATSFKAGWLCVLDRDGNPLSTRPTMGSLVPVRAWSASNGGVVVYATNPGIEQAFPDVLLSLDSQANVISHIKLDMPATGHDVHGVARADDSSLVLVGQTAIEDRQQPFVLRLPPPAGDGDMRELPLQHQ